MTATENKTESFEVSFETRQLWQHFSRSSLYCLQFSDFSPNFNPLASNIQSCWWRSRPSSMIEWCQHKRQHKIHRNFLRKNSHLWLRSDLVLFWRKEAEKWKLNLSRNDRLFPHKTEISDTTETALILSHNSYSHHQNLPEITRNLSNETSRFSCSPNLTRIHVTVTESAHHGVEVVELVHVSSGWTFLWMKNLHLPWSQHWRHFHHFCICRSPSSARNSKIDQFLLDCIRLKSVYITADWPA
jgi:hypothetical protein